MRDEHERDRARSGSSPARSLRRPPGPRPAGSARSSARPGPCGAPNVRRGSSRDPSSRSARRSPRRRLPPPSPPPARTAAGVAPESAAATAASTAGVQASTIVFSPACGLAARDDALERTPRAARRRPGCPARGRRRRLRRAQVGRAVQRSGSAADGGHERRRDELEHLADVGGLAPRARRASACTAVKPRKRFSPWSPSPICRSSSMSSDRCSVTVCADRRTHAIAHATSNVMSAPSTAPEAAAPASSPATCPIRTYQRSAVVCTGASHRAVSSSSSRRTVTRRALHLQRRHVVADERAGHDDPALLEQRASPTIDDVELEAAGCRPCR